MVLQSRRLLWTRYKVLDGPKLFNFEKYKLRLFTMAETKGHFKKVVQFDTDYSPTNITKYVRKLCYSYHNAKNL